MFAHLNANHIFLLCLLPQSPAARGWAPATGNAFAGATSASKSGAQKVKKE